MASIKQPDVTYNVVFEDNRKLLEEKNGHREFIVLKKISF